MKYASFLLTCTIAAWVVVPGQVLAGSGVYVSGELGANFASGLDTTGYSNDRASVCDEYINPSYDQVETSPGTDPDGHLYSSAYNCTGPNRGESGDWQNEFDGATGILAGAAIGYSFAGQNPNSPWGGLRVELEYFYRQSKYDETSDVPSASGESGEKLEQELVQAIDRIGSITAHNLFGNVFYDFVNTSRFTPYIGIGGGIGVTDMEYGSVWARNDDASKISTGGGEPGLPNAAEIRENLAGTVSVAQATISDTLYGLQLLFGVDYAVTEALSLGLKGRWARFSSFDSGINSVVWDPLRSHEPYLRKDGPDREPVSGGVSTNDIEFFGVSVNMKYHF